MRVLSPRSNTGGCAAVHLRLYHMHLHDWNELGTVTETTSMRESNGTNLKTIRPIAFLASL
jgi:hypothetical protein